MCVTFFLLALVFGFPAKPAGAHPPLQPFVPNCDHDGEVLSHFTKQAGMMGKPHSLNTLALGGLHGFSEVFPLRKGPNHICPIAPV